MAFFTAGKIPEENFSVDYFGDKMCRKKKW